MITDLADPVVARPHGSGSPSVPPSERQSEILREIVTYYRVTGEGCRASYLVRKFVVSRATVRVHLETLYRKGWLASPTSPVVPRRKYLIRRHS